LRRCIMVHFREGISGEYRPSALTRELMA